MKADVVRQWRKLPKDFPPKSTTHDCFVELQCTGACSQEFTMRSYLTHPAGVPVWVAEVRVVKRTYGWLGRCPRMVKDYENLTRSHIGFILRR